MIFTDRADAGKQLASKLQAYAGRSDVVVLALPRGGVPVGYEVARALSAPLDVFIVRKVGVPGKEELAMGAIASGGIAVYNQEVIHYLGITQAEFDRVCAQEEKELQRREQVYRGTNKQLDIAGQTVLLIDDGIATGASMEAAITAAKQYHPAGIVVAVPVAAPSSCRHCLQLADDVVCLIQPADFQAVSSWYKDFSQTSDVEVSALLAKISIL